MELDVDNMRGAGDDNGFVSLLSQQGFEIELGGKSYFNILCRADGEEVFAVGRLKPDATTSNAHPDLVEQVYYTVTDIMRSRRDFPPHQERMLYKLYITALEFLRCRNNL